MFEFETEQKIYEIGSIRLGGQPGQLPTVMIGSMFHRGHGIVSDHGRGNFDEQKARHLIQQQDDLSDQMGIPCMIDVFGETPTALEKYVEFVSEVTDAPFLLNAPTADARIQGTRSAGEMGLLDRTVYNSINYTLNEQEIESIKETSVKSALIQSMNPRNTRLGGMKEIIKKDTETGLLADSVRAGIERPLLLAPVYDVPSMGLGLKGVHLLKSAFGLPTGIPPVGVIGTWDRIERLGKDIKSACRASALALSQYSGSDFIIYGSIARAPDLFPACAMVDIIVAYITRQAYGTKLLTENHPFYKVLR
jgi:tetrahydromethanopterin S-methyltransferase subunit H